MSQSASSDGYVGDVQLADRAADYHAHTFLIATQLAKKFGAQVVSVTAVTGGGGAVAPVGFVDVTILVNQIDGLGNPTPHGVVHGLPYLRIQGGANAVIIDPEVGDIGLAVFCDRDISAVKATRARSNPGSRRRNAASDGVYLGGVLALAPTQYIRFSTDGIFLVSTTAVTIVAPSVQVNP